MSETIEVLIKVSGTVLIIFFMSKCDMHQKTENTKVRIEKIKAGIK